MQKSISERTTHRTLKQMGYSSRRPHRVPLLSAKNWKLRLQFAQARTWKYGSILSCLNGSGWCWWCNGVVIFSWHTLGPLVPIEHRLNATAYLSIDAVYRPSFIVHHFMTTVYPSSDSYFQQDNAPCQKAQIISDWFLEHDNKFTLLKCPPQSPHLNPIEHCLSEKEYFYFFNTWVQIKVALLICASGQYFLLKIRVFTSTNVLKMEMFFLCVFEKIQRSPFTAPQKWLKSPIILK